ncbi:MAG: hypothetical protein ABEH83_09225 [Halobacterium sp.]
MRKQIAAIAVAALLVFAGCSAGGDGGATTAAPETTDAPTDTTATESSDDGPVYESPLDAATVADNHESAIRDAGTFTLVSTSNQTQGGQSYTVTSTVAADVETGEFLTEQQAAGRVIEVYGFGNGTAYRRVERSSGETQYAVPPQTPNASQLAGGDIESFVKAFSFDHAGSETIDGTSTHVYEASGVEDINESEFSNLDVENVSSIDAGVYVTDDGLVKQFEYSMTVSTQNGDVSISVRQRYTDVGSTTIEQPPWLDEARANTSQ